MSKSRVSTSPAACVICEALVTSSVKGVTRLSAFCCARRVPAYTLFAPRLSASLTSARPIPRLAPVIKTVLFVIFMTVLLFQSSFVQNRENKLTSHVSLIAPGALAKDTHPQLHPCDSCRLGDLGLSFYFHLSWE